MLLKDNLGLNKCAVENSTSNQEKPHEICHSREFDTHDLDKAMANEEKSSADSGFIRDSVYSDIDLPVSAMQSINLKEKSINDKDLPVSVNEKVSDTLKPSTEATSGGANTETAAPFSQRLSVIVTDLDAASMKSTSSESVSNGVSLLHFQ